MENFHNIFAVAWQTLTCVICKKRNRDIYHKLCPTEEIKTSGLDQQEG